MQGRGWIPVAAICAVLVWGCGDDERPRTDALDPTLENVWPNENGRAWAYEMTARSWGAAFPDTVYADADSVPAAPSLAEIIPLLGDRKTPAPAETVLWTYGMQFDDSVTTESGVTAQKLVETLDSGSLMAGRFPTTRMQAGAGFLRSLVRARPDLRPRVEALLATASLDLVATPPLLPGGAWEKTSEHIGLYGDMDTHLSWKFLGANLRPGREFTQQLVPWAADDVFLHARVLRVVQVTTPVGIFENGVEVAYLVDYGVTRVVDAGSPEGIGFVRSLTYGTVVYAPTVGPVRVYEREGITVGKTLSEGVEDWELALTAVKAGSGT